MDSEQWDRRYAGSELVWTAQPNRFLVSEVSDLQPGRALDLACGEGRNTVWLAEQGWRARGVDFSSVAIEKARELAAAREVEADWEVADLSAYRPPAGAFDLVVVFYLQVPAAQRTPILAAAAAAVADGGTLLVVAHDLTNLDNGYGGPQDPTVLYRAEDVIADLADSGLMIERGERVERPVATDTGERVALDALVRARRG
ncbi:bifunctional 2-polyprenyl-6-hydroxyphenol methylase/3-demethylubiquinol 3-O-methyltransferase UbiG [Conexibacter sp. DBS9H8]|uniref:class I SAM-dependent methyltransferase n=1 Tax=Conexibacter sp. DBS9H8 TaxID=2937801 RepID=UPI00200CB632|nr:class I SAM-dependent methyltransferase [Conexibacter sp. DBS9H8]